LLTGFEAFLAGGVPSGAEERVTMSSGRVSGCAAGVTVFPAVEASLAGGCSVCRRAINPGAACVMVDTGDDMAYNLY